jgi:hypothetical protein
MKGLLSELKRLFRYTRNRVKNMIMFFYFKEMSRKLILKR